jgi:hypothetical protein
MATEQRAEEASTRRQAYADLVLRVRRLIESAVPEGATVAVVSKGDSELLRLAGRNGWHFPRAVSGAYAGHHPAGDEDAIARLEVMRTEGAGFLVFPAPAYWWLDFYRGFANHLEGRYRRVAEMADTAIVYSLSAIADTTGAGEAHANQLVLDQIRSLASGLLPVGAQVAVASLGDPRMLELGGPVGWHFPQREGGYYEDCDPPSGNAAAAHLEVLRHAGAEYLLIPRSSDEWLDRYPHFKAYLGSSFSLVTRQQNVCTIYDLCAISVKPGPSRLDRRTNA